MTVGPYNVQRVIERLKAEVTGLRKVGGAAELAAVANDPVRPPCAFVMLSNEIAQPHVGASSGVLQQRVTCTIGVLTGIQVYGDSTGGKKPEELTTILAAQRQALINWNPTGDSSNTMLELADGRVYDFRDQVIWWLDRYRFEYWVEKRQ